MSPRRKKRIACSNIDDTNCNTMGEAWRDVVKGGTQKINHETEISTRTNPIIAMKRMPANLDMPNGA